jgi:hypothetical protein
MFSVDLISFLVATKKVFSKVAYPAGGRQTKRK